MAAKIITILLCLGGGFVLIRYTNWLYYTFGSIDWAERYLRLFGGSRLVLKILGLILIFVGAYLLAHSL